jgi:hypothetical protein
MTSENHLQRIRRICAALPETTERLSHGEPTFFVHKKVFAMFANNHHNDGHIAVYLPTPPGIQEILIDTAPQKFFKPPYVGVRGWVGIELDRIDDTELTSHLHEAWRLIAPKRLHPAIDETAGSAVKPAKKERAKPTRKSSGIDKAKTK